VSSYGFFGQNHTETTFLWYDTSNATIIEEKIASPALNISGFYPDSTYDIYGYYWTDPQTNKTPFQNPANRAFMLEDQFFDSAAIERNGTCQAEPSYKWGFSFLTLFITTALLLVWGIASYLIWLESYLALQYFGHENIGGEYKAILKIAALLRDDLVENDKDLDKFTENEIKRHLHYTMAGGSIDHQTTNNSSEFSLRRLIVERLKGEDKWWIIVLICLFIAIPIVMFTAVRLWPMIIAVIILSCVAVGIAFALYIGHTNRSRLLILTLFLMIGGIVTVSVIGGMQKRTGRCYVDYFWYMGNPLAKDDESEFWYPRDC
jgi:hypothetical protein